MRNKIIGVVVALLSIFVFALSSTFDSILLSVIFVTLGYVCLIGGVVLAATDHEDNE